MRLDDLLQRALAGRGPWRVSEVLLAEAILSCTPHPGRFWWCRLAAMSPIGEEETIRRLREMVRSGRAPHAYEFLSTADTWKLWVCGEAEAQWPTVLPRQAVLAELIDVADFWDLDRIVAASQLTVWPPVTRQVAECRLDLVDMGLLVV